MRHRKSWLLAAAVVFALGCPAGDDDDDTSPTPTGTPGPCVAGDAPPGHPLTAVGLDVGESPPDFPACLSDVGGLEHALYQYLGDVVLLSIGAMWNPPEQNEAADLQVLYETYEDQGFEIIVAMVEGMTAGTAVLPSELNDWTLNYSVTHILIGDPSASLHQYYLPTDALSYPLRIIVDRGGVVDYRAVGTAGVSTYEPIITAALAEPNPF